MDQQVQQALARNQTIDITTIGRKTGQERRIEIWFHYLGDGEMFITGSPGKRDWYANMLAHPDFTLHLKETLQADLPARAVAITDKAQRQDIISRIVQKWEKQPGNLDQWVNESPLVRVEF